ncbi:MAG: metallophosphoesterase [Clostridia bacterium]|nr:metallophosphoesterase [Clostridia bacterium]
MKQSDKKPSGKTGTASGKAPKTKRKSNKAVPKPIATTMRLGRTLRTGGAFIVRESRKAYDTFNTFTQTGEITTDKKKKKAKPVPEKGRINRNLAYVLFILGIAVVLSISLMILNNASVEIERKTVSVVGLNSDLEGYRILVLSDLHGRSFGNGQTSLLRTINSLGYDMVLFTGDMVGKGGNPQPFYDILEGISANRPKYFIAGDSDPAPVLSEPREDGGTLNSMVLNDWVLGAQERGAVYLDVTQGLTVGRAHLWLSPVNALTVNVPEGLDLFNDQLDQETEGSLYGVEVDYNQLPLTTYRRNLLLKLDDTLHSIGTEDLHIGVSHIPPSDDYMAVALHLGQTAQEYDYLPPVDLVFAGHYCGGGWQIPFYGAFFIPNTFLPRHGWFPDQSLVQGLRQVGTVQMYTSPGLSVSDRIFLPNFRVFNSPRITLITLTAAITDDLLGNG